MKEKDKAPTLKAEVGFSEFMERLLRVKKEEIQPNKLQLPGRSKQDRRPEEGRK